jgi:hypothetical protein
VLYLDVGDLLRVRIVGVQLLFGLAMKSRAELMLALENVSL